VATSIDTILPRVSANLLSGLLETLAAEPYNGKADLPVIAELLHMEADDLFPVSDALQMLHLAEIEGGDIKLTDVGKQFAEFGMDDRKKLFQRQLLAYVPLAAHIRRVLQERANHSAPKSRFLDELEDHMSLEDAEHTLRAVIAWGRYAEVFAYDDDSGAFSLENPS
jgi:NitT/TauT family transport system ATP-binding protein